MLQKRLLYLGYYLKELDWKKFNKFLKFAIQDQRKSSTAIIVDALTASMKYNISLIDYFLFRFYKLSHEQRKTFAGTGFLYEYQLIMNPKKVRSVLENKFEFLAHFSNFVRHDFASLALLKEDQSVGARVLANKSGKVVLKSSNGQCGSGIEVRDTKDFTPHTLVQRLQETENDLAEEYVIQHDALMKLSPAGLNTIRIITQLAEGDLVIIVGARLRITVNSSVDNLAAGNLAAPIDIQTGIVNDHAVYSDITKSEETHHPVTKVEIKNFRIPFWKETIDMVKDAALVSKGNRSIGWDIAITNSGPELIEGNHNWCKLLWQLPVKKGLKHELERYLKGKALPDSTNNLR